MNKVSGILLVGTFLISGGVEFSYAKNWNQTKSKSTTAKAPNPNSLYNCAYWDSSVPGENFALTLQRGLGDKRFFMIFLKKDTQGQPLKAEVLPLVQKEEAEYVGG